MKIFIEQTSNEGEGRKLSLTPGQQIHVGRGASADLVVTDDDKMSGEHFAIEVENDSCRLRNLRSYGVTTINGQPVDGEAELHDGDEIVAGLTSFRISVTDAQVASAPVTSVQEVAEPPLNVAKTDFPEPDAGGADTGTTYTEPTALAAGSQSADGQAIRSEASAVGSPNQETNSAKLEIESDLVQPEPTEPDPLAHLKAKLFDPTVPMDEVKTKVWEYLNQLQQPLFALLDAARDPLVPALILHCDLEYQSLYEGQEAPALVKFGPYLVKLPTDSIFLRALIRYGWGESWGVYLTSNQSLEDIRENLRKFLKVSIEGSEKEVLFRFYDPRVMRVFLPTNTPEESEKFFGPVTSFYLEDEKPENLLRFLAEKNGAQEFEPLDKDLQTQVPPVPS